jgi:putative salt-induced outer membrane protein YdiY
MSPNRPSPERAVQLSLGLAGLLALGLQFARAENVVLHLRNGDRIAGTIVAEDTNRVVLATSWIKELPVPLSAILGREPITNAVTPTAVTAAKPAAPAPEPAATNIVAATKATPLAATVAPEQKPPKPKHWKANLSLGTDLKFGASDQALYYGRFKLTYEQPYKSEAKNFFRNIFDYAVDYGETDGVKSADRMYGSMKTDFDVGRGVFVYNLAGAGYDTVRKIDFGYEIGPGVGYHLFTQPKLVMNLEGGINYQVQERSGSPDVQSFYFRVAEDVTWKITPRVTLVEKAELFPRVENPGEFRARLDSALSFALWQNLALKLSVLDLYDTNPAQGVDPNDLQIRSSLEITF